LRQLFLVFFCLTAGSARAQTADTLFTRHDLFDGSDVVLAGGFVAATALAAPADRWFTRELQDDARQANRALHRGAQVFRVVGHPGGMIAGGTMYLAGLATDDRRIEDLGLHSVESIVLGHMITGTIKVVAGRARPFVSKDNARNFKLFRGLRDDDYRSFPSGHATAAFAFASVISAETSHWWPESRWIVGPVMYGAATLTGVSRIYDNQHWASDILAGAAIGTISGIKLFRYQHSHPDNRLDKKLLRAGVSVSNNGALTPVLSVVRR
jgi:membrane-associated phospholipid phosphatase